jgi:DNA-binding CsgD family transcriptional regulator
MEATLFTPGAVEYYAIDGKVGFVKNREFHPFSDLPCSDALALRRDMETDPLVCKALEKEFPADPIKQLRQYAACRYGRFNETPDFVNGRANDCETPIPNCLANCRFTHKICSHTDAKYGKLTPRETDVIRLVPGRTNKEIANFMGVSVNTVITFVSRIMQKLGCHERSSLVLYAISHNLI